MNDKIITHADLDAARALVEAVNRHGTEASRELARSILAAAEADQPPLPEGWVLYAERTPFWHQDGRLYRGKGLTTLTHDERDIEVIRDLLTPLRPTVTEAEVEKAAQKIEEVVVFLTYADLARAAFKAAGIEVQH